MATQSQLFGIGAFSLAVVLLLVWMLQRLLSYLVSAESRSKRPKQSRSYDDEPQGPRIPDEETAKRRCGNGYGLLTLLGNSLCSSQYRRGAFQVISSHRGLLARYVGRLLRRHWYPLTLSLIIVSLGSYLVMTELVYNPYAALGLQAGATPHAIRSAWRVITRDNHPDKNPGNATAQAIYDAAQRAYDVLKTGEDTSTAEEDSVPGRYSSSVAVPEFVLKKASIIVPVGALIAVAVAAPYAWRAWRARNGNQESDLEQRIGRVREFLRRLDVVGACAASLPIPVPGLSRLVGTEPAAAPAVAPAAGSGAMGSAPSPVTAAAAAEPERNPEWARGAFDAVELLGLFAHARAVEAGWRLNANPPKQFLPDKLPPQYPQHPEIKRWWEALRKERLPQAQWAHKMWQEVEAALTSVGHVLGEAMKGRRATGSDVFGPRSAPHKAVVQSIKEAVEARKEIMALLDAPPPIDFSVPLAPPRIFIAGGRAPAHGGGCASGCAH